MPIADCHYLNPSSAIRAYAFLLLICTLNVKNHTIQFAFDEKYPSRPCSNAHSSLSLPWLLTLGGHTTVCVPAASICTLNVKNHTIQFAFDDIWTFHPYPIPKLLYTHVISIRLKYIWKLPLSMVMCFIPRKYV